MSGYIEIIGAPGTGKTFLYNVLMKQWGRNCYWNPYENLGQRRPAKLISFKTIRYVFSLFKQGFENKNKEAANRFITKHQNFATFSWELINMMDYDHLNREVRFRYIRHLYNVYSRIQFIRESDSKYPYIIDDGLLQKTFLMLLYSQQDLNHVEKYFDLMPLPKALIALRCEDHELTANRLLNREKKISLHDHRSFNDLIILCREWNNFVVYTSDYLREKGVEVLFLNAENDILHSVKMAQTFLTRLT